VTGLILPLAFRLYEFAFLVVLLLAARAWWRGWSFSRPATTWATAEAEVTETAPRGELAAVFRDRNGRKGTIALRALLPPDLLARLAAGDRFALTYSVRDRSLTYVPAQRDWMQRRLSGQRWALTIVLVVMGVGLSLFDQVAMPG